MSPPDEDTLHSVPVARVRDGATTPDEDAVAREEPLALQLGSQSLAVVMRTPGDDEELATGFLVTERVVACASDVVAVRHCTLAPSPEAVDNVIRVTLAPEIEVDLDALRRNLYASSSCGICGKATLESVLAVAPPLDDPTRLPPAFFRDLPEQLRRGQATFARTGGLHAAALFQADGRLCVVREDIGRHNAVDKVVGWAARSGRLPLSGHVLLVSGRISYEIVQKALAARIPVVAAVSAPSSLAVDLAREARMALVGFLREGRFNVYGHRDRVAPA